jgi:hypothetical protein
LNRSPATPPIAAHNGRRNYFTTMISNSAPHTTMINIRQKVQICLLLALILFTFASYHEGTGNTTWLMWLTAVVFAVFTLVFDCVFTNESGFIFDPDADNWRRKTVRACISIDRSG